MPLSDTLTAATEKKKKTQPASFGVLLSNVNLCDLHSEATGRILLFPTRADWRYLENDTNSNL